MDADYAGRREELHLHMPGDVEVAGTRLLSAEGEPLAAGTLYRVLYVNDIAELRGVPGFAGRFRVAAFDVKYTRAATDPVVVHLYLTAAESSGDAKIVVTGA